MLEHHLPLTRSRGGFKKKAAETMTFQEAKDKIAKDHGYKDWKSVDWYELDALNQTKEPEPTAEELLLGMAADLYASSKWDEACKHYQEILFVHLENGQPLKFMPPKPEFKP